jgi:tetratricopeptide (TPR) repeat protein
MAGWLFRTPTALWSIGLFILGMGAGGLLTVIFYTVNPPAPQPSGFKPAASLEEAHRLLDKGLYAEAEKSYQSILVRDPGNPEAITHLGNIAFQRGDVDKALRYFEEALLRDPAYAHALWDKGIALRAKGDNAAAIAAWEAFARLFPPDSPDVVQVKKWIAEAKGSQSSAAFTPPKSIR